MAKRNAAAEEQHPFDWALTAIHRCKELLAGYEFLKDALDQAQQSLERDGHYGIRGHSNTARDITGDLRRLREHYARCPENWPDFLSDVKKANPDHQKNIHVGTWIAYTATQAAELLAKEFIDEFAAIVMDWWPGPAPVWDSAYFDQHRGKLAEYRETAEDIDERIAVWPVEELDKLYTHVEHEATRYDNFIDEQARRTEDAERKERELKLLETLATTGGGQRREDSQRTKAPAGTPGRKSDPLNDARAEFANKLRSEVPPVEWKEITKRINSDSTLRRPRKRFSSEEIRSLHKYKYPKKIEPTKKPAVKR